MDRFRASLRTVPSYNLWLEFAEDPNRLGLDMLRDNETLRHDNQKITVAALFVRAHQSLQAALLLAEPPRGDKGLAGLGDATDSSGGAR